MKPIFVIALAILLASCAGTRDYTQDYKRAEEASLHGVEALYQLHYTHDRRLLQRAFLADAASARCSNFDSAIELQYSDYFKYYERNPSRAKQRNFADRTTSRLYTWLCFLVSTDEHREFATLKAIFLFDSAIPDVRIPLFFDSINIYNAGQPKFLWHIDEIPSSQFSIIKNSITKASVQFEKFKSSEKFVEFDNEKVLLLRFSQLAEKLGEFELGKIIRKYVSEIHEPRLARIRGLASQLMLKWPKFGEHWKPAHAILQLELIDLNHHTQTALRTKGLDIFIPYMQAELAFLQSEKFFDSFDSATRITSP